MGNFYGGCQHLGSFAAAAAARGHLLPGQAYVMPFPSVLVFSAMSSLRVRYSFFLDIWPIFAWYISPCVLAFNFSAFHCYIVLPENSIELGVIVFCFNPIWSCLLDVKNGPVFTWILIYLDLFLSICLHFHFSSFLLSCLNGDFCFDTPSHLYWFFSIQAWNLYMLILVLQCCLLSCLTWLLS